MCVYGEKPTLPISPLKKESLSPIQYFINGIWQCTTVQILSHIVFIYYVCAMYIPWPVCGGQRMSFRSWFSPTVFVLGTELRSSGLMASSFTHWAISLARQFCLRNLLFTYIKIDHCHLIRYVIINFKLLGSVTQFQEKIYKMLFVSDL